MYQLVWCYSILHAAIVYLGCRSMSKRWYIRLFTVQTSEYVCLHVFKYSVQCQFMYGLVSNSQTSEKSDLAPAAPPTETDLCGLAYTHVCSIHRFLSAVELRSQCLPFSILRRMANDVNLSFLPNSFCFCLIYCHIFLSLRLSVYAYSRMDFGMEISEWMFSDAV